MGGNKGVSIERDEKKPARIDMGNKTPLNPKREGEKEDHELQRILRLASWNHSYTVMNRPSRVEESTAWGSLLPWLQ